MSGSGYPTRWEIRSLAMYATRGRDDVLVKAEISRIVLEGISTSIQTIELDAPVIGDGALLFDAWKERRYVEIVEKHCPTCGKLDAREVWWEDERIL